MGLRDGSQFCMRDHNMFVPKANTKIAVLELESVQPLWQNISSDLSSKRGILLIVFVVGNDWLSASDEYA